MNKKKIARFVLSMLAIIIKELQGVFADENKKRSPKNAKRPGK